MAKCTAHRPQSWALNLVPPGHTQPLTTCVFTEAPQPPQEAGSDIIIRFPDGETDSEKPTAGGRGCWELGRGGQGLARGGWLQSPSSQRYSPLSGLQAGPSSSLAGMASSSLLQANTSLTFQPERMVPLPPTMSRPFSCYFSRFRPCYRTGFPFASQPWNGRSLGERTGHC